MRIGWSVLILLLWGLCSVAQQSAPPAPSIPSTGFPGLDHFRASQIATFTDDFGQLSRYRDANAGLAAPAAGEDRVVFFGDSITDAWKLAESFPGKPYIDRGISGQTTPQMLVRFRQDVINLHPRVVVILAGVNDIAGNTGPTTPEMIQDNLISMVDLATANGIKVVLASITPADDFPWNPGTKPASKIAAMNVWIKDYAAKHALVYADYYSAMADENGAMKREFTGDGVHPNAAGYGVMGPIAEK